MGTSEEIKAEYTSSLADLTTNSKPLINVLTMLADEYGKEHAKEIVEAIETHLAKVSTDVKLPILYLIDSIVKNVDNTYTELFSQNIVSTFCNVFKLVDEPTRSEMFKLRQTWNDVFPQSKLYAIDVQIRLYDPAWPVTAQPVRPSTANPTGKNSIYFNPRFLKNSNNPGKTSGTVDAETLKMQEKLIQKQKELIELQQKKLELEVLQTQVKLREQISNGKSAPIINPNLLLKPNVMATLTTNENAKNKTTNNMTLMNQRAANAPRITPVSSALVSATAKKPIVRDPRLLRQQQQQEHLRQQHQDQHNQQFHQKTTPSNVQLGQKSIESNKIVTTNKRVRDNERGEPQRPLILSNNKDKDENNHSLSHTSSNSSSNSNKKSSRSNQDKHSSSSSSKSKRSDMDRFDSKSGGSKSSSTSSLDSPSKNKSDKSSPKSPSKYKISKKDNKQNNDDSGSKKAKHYIASNSSGNPSGTSTAKHKNEANLSLPSAPGAASFSSSFKIVKNSKNRNYVRRNLSKSPETVQDEDLRAAYGPPDKVPRLMEDESKKDVDLRVIPVTSKKRQSSDNPDPSATKKSKTEVFDVLFGDQDTDLRQLTKPPSDRPPTPPPPIISSSDSEPAQKKSNSDFDAIRAKLANATNRDKILSKSFNKKRMANEDRVTSTTSDISDKILITPDDEKCIKSGTLSKEKEQQLLNQIIMQVERNKLREAKLKEKESTKSSNIQQIEDSSSDASSSSDEERNRKSSHHPYDKFQRGTNNARGKWRPGPRRNRFEPIPPTSTMPGIPPPLRGPPSRVGPWMQAPPMQKPWRQMGPNMSPWVAAPAHQKPFDDENVGTKSPDVNDKLVVDSVNQDDIKTIQIDSIPREIRYYDDTAVIFMSWDDPREISFQNGTRRIIFNEHDTYLLGFNEPDKDVMVNGNLVRVRLGAPTREVFVNGKPYECYFGGPGIPIEINGQKLHLMLEGPPPQVKIGTEKRTDLVAGKVNLIINAKIIVPVYLDAKLQKFVVDGETVTLKFVDALKTVLINNVPFVVEFGGLPKPITIHNKKHFIRFSVLPKGIKPGNVNIKDMDSYNNSSNNDAGKTNTVVSEDVRLQFNNDNDNSVENETGNIINMNNAAGVDENSLASINTANLADANKNLGNESPERNSNSPSFFQNILQHQNMSNLDVLSNAITNAAVNTPSTSGYQVASASQSIHDQSSNPLPDITSSQSNQLSKSNILPPTLNINDLFQKLVSTGVLTSVITPASSAETKETLNPPSTTVSALESLSVAPPISTVPITTVAHTSSNVSSLHHTISSTSNMSNMSTTPFVPNNVIHSAVLIGPKMPLHLQDNFSAIDPKPRKNIFENLKAITFQRPETLKLRQSALYLALYSGMQCSSCGMRFPPEQSMQYSQHLDWHFRQNRKGKKNIRVASSRKWYYSMADWKNYEEIEDLEEREKNYFDQQMTQNEANADDESEDLEEPSVPADPDVTDERCEVCHDVLEQFFNEEKEEWHLRNALRIDEKTYHPACYEDYQKALEEANDDSKIENEETSEDVQSANKEELIPGLEIILDDDDDEVEEKQNEEIVEVSKNEEPIEESTKEDDNEENDSEDDDVIINEVAPVRIVVDDDDDDDDNDMPHNDRDSVEKDTSTPTFKSSSATEMDDGFVDVSVINLKNGGSIRIKPEPLDEEEMADCEDYSEVNNEDEMKNHNEEIPSEETAETSSIAPLDIPAVPEPIASNPLELVSSIDGNVLESGTVVPPSTTASIAGKIKINISKPLPALPTRESAVGEATKANEGNNEEPTTLDESEPPMPKYNKPALEGLELKKMPPVQKGSELTGMCSIM